MLTVLSHCELMPFNTRNGGHAQINPITDLDPMSVLPHELLSLMHRVHVRLLSFQVNIVVKLR